MKWAEERLRQFPEDDITGNRYGKLTVIKFVGYKMTANKRRNPVWHCECDCGKFKDAYAVSLKKYNGMTSCGCSKKILREKKPVTYKARGSGFNSLYRAYKSRAKKIGREFSLSEDLFREITSSSCFFCGVPPKQCAKKNGGITIYEYNGIDRIDNSLGYTKENSLPCCGKCNGAKSNMKIEDFLDWLGRLLENASNRNLLEEIKNNKYINE
jgi:hypothetical protein